MLLAVSQFDSIEERGDSNQNTWVIPPLTRPQVELSMFLLIRILKKVKKERKKERK
jgi:hypothetical protein